MLNTWIAAFRLKTLPLAFGSIILGSWMADELKPEILGLALLTAVLLQILSNLANDYGDFTKGTDAHRADRQMGSGKIQAKQMKRAIVLFAVLSLLSGLYLLYVSFGVQWNQWLIFLAFGLGSIAAALAYTMGKRAYGYYGLGDLFVFLFFGLLGVAGSSYLYDGVTEASRFLAAMSYGLLCVAVLNVNNIRDLEKDVLNNKITLASKMGHIGALNYQAFIFILSFLFMAGHHLIEPYTSLAPIGIAYLGYSHMAALRQADKSDDYNAQLKYVSLGSLAITILFIFQLHL
jgi:1,4-dihydroxy-2-naphthoate octaprenyltransferase